VSTNTATTTASASESLAVPREVWRIAGVIVFGAFMAGLDTSLVNVGLNTIGMKLNASLTSVQWVTSGYLLALAAALPVCGWLGRYVGVGRLWLGALAAFTVISGLCALAPNIGMLIALRVAQGVAGGLLVPTGQTIVGRAAGPGRMGRVMNTVGIAVVLAPAIGPTIGGLLIAHLSWRWLFLINIPVGAIAFALGLRILPRDQTRAAGPLDRTGLLLVTAGLPLLTYGIITASDQRSITDARALTCLLTGLLTLTLFIWRSLRISTPLLNLRVFTNRTYTAAETSVFLTGAAQFGGMIILPLYFELLRHKDVVDTGLLLLAYGIGAAIAMRIGGTLTDRYGGGITSAAGLAITVATTIPLAFFDANVSLIAIEALLFLRGAGLGLSGLPAMSAAYATVSKDDLPDATATANILQRTGGALGSALFVVILETNTHNILDAFHTTFWWLTITSIAALAGALWLTTEQRRRTQTPATSPAA
jgi:EmrB/QacA subfamily drug resistance transporter